MVHDRMHAIDAAVLLRGSRGLFSSRCCALEVYIVTPTHRLKPMLGRSMLMYSYEEDPKTEFTLETAMVSPLYATLKHKLQHIIPTLL